MRPRIVILLLALVLSAVFFVLKERAASAARPGLGPTGDPRSARHHHHGEGPAGGSASEGPGTKSTDRVNGNPARDKVITTPSGLQYEILATGAGPRPGPESIVQVSYVGTLPDGTIFDRTPEDQPMNLALNATIKGWQEGLQLMPVGSRYRFTIPPDLAYGETGAGDWIPPNATLVFVVELLDLPPPPETVEITDGRIEMPVFSTRRITDDTAAPEPE